MQIKKTIVKEKIMNAGKKLFLEKGFRGTSMKDIAKEANLSTSNIYTYVKNKEDFLHELIKDAIWAYKKFLEERSTKEVWENPKSWTMEVEIEVFKEFINMLYTYKDEFLILFLKSQGSKYEHFYEEILNVQFQESTKVNKKMEGCDFDYLKEEVPEYITRNAVRMYMNIIMEGLKDGISQDEMNQRMSECVKFLFRGYEVYFSDKLIKNK